MSRVDLAKGARVIVETLGGAQKSDKVLVICDRRTTTTAEALVAAAMAVGAETLLLTMAPRRWHNDELPSPMAAAMKESDLILAPTTDRKSVV